ncbi:discoidin domain-containing protein [Candidatus Poribacteria bacterium]
MSRSGKQIVDKAATQMGKEDGPPPGIYGGKGEQWCSEFVSWVYKEAGYPFKPGKEILTSTRRIIKWFRRKSTYIERRDSDWDDFTPTPGDYVYIGRAGDSDRKHSGIVDYVDSEGTLHTIEGNNRRRPVDKYIYPNFRTNTTNNDPPKTKGIVLGFGLRCGMGLRLPNGVASASSSENNQQPDKAFDGNDNTNWRNEAQQPDSQYLEMAWDKSQTVTRVALKFGDHYPEDYQFRFKAGLWKRWKWSTKITGNDRQAKVHVWFSPKKKVRAVRLYCLAYSQDDYFSVVDMNTQR